MACVTVNRRMERKPEPYELMETEEQLRVYATSQLSEPFIEFVKQFSARYPRDVIDGHVLDLGCGQGEVTFPFAKAHPYCRIDGIDGSAGMLYHARQKVRKLQWERLRFVEAYLPRDAPPKHDYDCIICNSLLHHLPDPATLWTTIKEHAKPGAPIFVMDLVRPASPAAAKSLVLAVGAGLHRVILKDFYYSLLAAYEVGEVEEQLRGAGLESLRVEQSLDFQLIVHGRME